MISYEYSVSENGTNSIKINKVNSKNLTYYLLLEHCLLLEIEKDNYKIALTLPKIDNKSCDIICAHASK